MLSYESHSPKLAEIMDRDLNENLLCKWYPLVTDEKYGGHFTNVTYHRETNQSLEKDVIHHYH
jgi:hypothetical protein